MHQAKEFISGIYDDDVETILHDENRDMFIQSFIYANILLDDI